jgi:hypothetical protein
MKNIRLLMLVGLVMTMGILFITCNKGKTDPHVVNKNNLKNPTGTGNTAAREISELELPQDATEEMARIFNDIIDAEHVVAITANPNYGVYCSTCLSDTYLNGVTELADDISIIINENMYTPDDNGQFLIYNSSWPGLYDSNVDVEIKSGSTQLSSVTMHVPKRCLVTKLGTNGMIARSGNTLSWTPDQNNAVGYVILYYYLFDEDGDMIDTDGELLDDDGSFSIDNIISNTDVKSIYFQIITGNTTSTTVNNKKLLFIIESIDHHRYNIQ